MSNVSSSSDESGKPVLLVVEEEDGVRTLLRLALSRFGFTVLTAANGPEAVTVYQNAGQSIDLILMDVRMRGMDGPQTLDQIKQINPHVRCCFMTGDTAVSRREELLAAGALKVFRKPFLSMSQLAKALHALLNKEE
jgi:CheY-like chemotaxis protein